MSAPNRDMIPAWVDGILTPVEKLEVHQRGLRHKAVSVFINCRGATLLQQRALTKYHTPGLWANACCTHPLWEEEPYDCAVRRLREELNVSSAEPEYRGHVHYRADVGSGLIEDEEVDIFVVDSAEEQAVDANPDEVMDTCWISYEELSTSVAARGADYTPWLGIYMKQHGGLFRS